MSVNEYQLIFYHSRQSQNSQSILSVIKNNPIYDKNIFSLDFDRLPPRALPPIVEAIPCLYFHHSNPAERMVLYDNYIPKGSKGKRHVRSGSIIMQLTGLFNTTSKKNLSINPIDDEKLGQNVKANLNSDKPLPIISKLIKNMNPSNVNNYVTNNNNNSKEFKEYHAVVLSNTVAKINPRNKGITSQIDDKFLHTLKNDKDIKSRVKYN